MSTASPAPVPEPSEVPAHRVHPPWCTGQDDWSEDDIGTMHQGRVITVNGTIEGREHPVAVYAEFYHAHPQRNQPYEPPVVVLCPRIGDEVDFTAAAARELAAALLAVADELEPPAT